MKSSAIDFLISLAWLTLISGRVSAQLSEDRLRISREEVEHHIAELDLATAQREAAQAMFAEYEREFDESHDTLEKFCTWIFPSDDEGVDAPTLSETLAAEWRQLEDQWQVGARALESQYFDKIAALSPGLEPKIQELRRERLRHRMLHCDVLRVEDSDGVAVDLLAVLSDVNPALNGNPQIKPVLLEYELGMDQRLQRLDPLLPQYMHLWRSAWGEASRLIKTGQPAGAALDNIVEVSTKPYDMVYELRQFNLRFVERFAAVLAEPVAPDFRNAAHPLLYPFMYGKGVVPPDRQAEAALKSGSISDAQRQALLGLREEYLAARGSATAELNRLYERTISHEKRATDLQIMLEHWAAKQYVQEQPDADETAFEAATKAWKDRCAKFSEQISAVISPEQQRATNDATPIN